MRGPPAAPTCGQPHKPQRARVRASFARRCTKTNHQPINQSIKKKHETAAHIKPEGTHKERSQTRIALALERYISAAHGDIVRWPNNERSDRSLQVFDLKAAAAPFNSSVIEAIRTGSRAASFTRCNMHASCTLSRARSTPPWQTANRHESFKSARRNAVRRYLTSHSIGGNRMTQREQRKGDGEGCEC